MCRIRKWRPEPLRTLTDTLKETYDAPQFQAAGRFLAEDKNVSDTGFLHPGLCQDAMAFFREMNAVGGDPAVSQFLGLPIQPLLQGDKGKPVILGQVPDPAGHAGQPGKPQSVPGRNRKEKGLHQDQPGNAVIQNIDDQLLKCAGK